MKMTLLAAVVATALTLSGCEAGPKSTAQPSSNTVQGDANADNGSATTAATTNAPWIDSNHNTHYRVLAKSLSHPWAVAALPSGEYLVTLREGRLLRIGAQGFVKGFAGQPGGGHETGQRGGP